MLLDISMLHLASTIAGAGVSRPSREPTTLQRPLPCPKPLLPQGMTGPQFKLPEP